MTFLDTNVILRYVLADEASKTNRCERLFSRVAGGNESVMTHVLAIAEVIWVLTSTYHVDKERVVDALVSLLTLDALFLKDKECVLSALGLYRTQSIDFIDACHACFMHNRKLQTIYSYDSDFDHLPGIQRLEP